MTIKKEPYPTPAQYKPNTGISSYMKKPRIIGTKADNTWVEVGLTNRSGNRHRATVTCAKFDEPLCLTSYPNSK